MPCACKKPIENYPENDDWGPLIWTVLHGLAEIFGRQTSPVLQDDEKRLWIALLKGITYMLPCDKCRDHYAIWISTHNVDVILTMPYSEVGEWLRHWVFNLHNEVNVRTSKPLFSYEGLVKYKGIKITTLWRRLEPVMKLAIQLNGISLLPWKKWLAMVRSLQGIYGV